MVRDYSNLSEADRLIAEEIDREFDEELIEEENAIEAILFVSGDPVSITQTAKAMESSVEITRKAVMRLMERYEKKIPACKSENMKTLTSFVPRKSIIISL